MLETPCRKAYVSVNLDDPQNRSIEDKEVHLLCLFDKQAQPDLQPTQHQRKRG